MAPNNPLIDSCDGHPAGTGFDNLIILSRADPIICGHSTETRNLAEAAIAEGV